MNAFKHSLHERIFLLTRALSDINLLKRSVDTYRLNEPVNYVRMLEEFYETRKFHAMFKAEIMSTGLPDGEQHVAASRIIGALRDNKCYEYLISRTKIPEGINEINFASYVFTYYYISLIDSYSLDSEGLLKFVQYLATQVCQLNYDSFTTISVNILKAIEFDVSCKK